MMATSTCLKQSFASALLQLCFSFASALLQLCFGKAKVNQRAIEEALFGPIQDLTHEVESSGRPATKQLVQVDRISNSS